MNTYNYLFLFLSNTSQLSYKTQNGHEWVYDTLGWLKKLSAIFNNPIISFVPNCSILVQ